LGITATDFLIFQFETVLLDMSRLATISAINSSSRGSTVISAIVVCSALALEGFMPDLPTISAFTLELTTK